MLGGGQRYRVSTVRLVQDVGGPMLVFLPEVPSLGLGKVGHIDVHFNFNIYEAPVMCWTFTDTSTFHSLGLGGK